MGAGHQGRRHQGQGVKRMITRRRFVALARRRLRWRPASSARPARAQAQAWPNRFVQLVVPFTPGGGIDAHRPHRRRHGSPRCGASRWWSRTSRGAGGNIASEMVARADARRLHHATSPRPGWRSTASLFPSISYDPVADFAPVTLICLFPNLLVVPNASPSRSVADIIADAKANPGKITFASPGHGTSPHMSGELFKYMAKVDITHVPYRGAAPALHRPAGRPHRYLFRGDGVRPAAGPVRPAARRSA